MSNSKKILVATAFNKESEAALEYAVRLAEKIKSEIIIVHVIEQLSLIADDFFTGDLQKQMMNFAEHKIISYVNKIIGTRKVKTIPVVRKGKVYSIIPQIAKENQVEFILMGRSERQDGIRNIFGANTHNIISRSYIPVITTKVLKKQTGFNHILLPLDLTKNIKEKISEAVHIAKLFGARICIVSVLEKDWVSEEKQFTDRLQNIKEIFTACNIECSYKLTKRANNKISDVIINEGMSCNADLIMVMTQEESELRDFFIGSTASAIVRKSELPVISINPGAENLKELSLSMLKSVIDPIGLFRK